MKHPIQQSCHRQLYIVGPCSSKYLSNVDKEYNSIVKKTVCYIECLQVGLQQLSVIRSDLQLHLYHTASSIP